eukprot:6245161-Prymnesium_polylepis.1
MVYRHMFYAFASQPPFRVVAAGKPFALPRVEGSPETLPTVQFASGMVVDAKRDVVLVSYSELDCGAALVQLPLSTVLSELGFRY